MNIACSTCGQLIVTIFPGDLKYAGDPVSCLNKFAGSKENPDELHDKNEERSRYKMWSTVEGRQDSLEAFGPLSKFYRDIIMNNEKSFHHNRTHLYSGDLV
jgi:hypothetical protein